MWSMSLNFVHKFSLTDNEFYNSGIIIIAFNRVHLIIIAFNGVYLI